jgi:hypothetical protein
MATASRPDPAAFTRTLAADAQALRAATADVPGIEDTARALRQALQPQSRPVEPNGGLMTALYPLYKRPRLVTGALAGALLCGALLWPVSYERTVGHTITLSVAAEDGQPLPPQGKALSMRLRQALGGGAVRLSADGAGAPIALTARVPMRSRQQVERRLDELTAALRREHLKVQTSVSPRTEHHSGRVYAMALDKLIDIRVDTGGKTDSQVETEIRDQLTRSGMTPDSVQFQRTGDEASADISAHDDEHTLRLVRHQKGGPSELVMEAGDLDTERTPGMTDDQLRDKIQRQLAARGLTATVIVHGDQIQIRAEKTIPSSP